MTPGVCGKEAGRAELPFTATGLNAASTQHGGNISHISAIGRSVLQCTLREMASVHMGVHSDAWLLRCAVNGGWVPSPKLLIDYVLG